MSGELNTSDSNCRPITGTMKEEKSNLDFLDEEVQYWQKLQAEFNITCLMATKLYIL